MTTQSLPEKIFDDHPMLGAYRSHHPSGRGRLLLRGAILYAVPVLLLQILFWDVDTPAASIFLPISFGAVGLGVVWYIAHLWNREIILYERGFTYREGSRIGEFRYDQIVRVRQKIEQIALFGFLRITRYDYTLISAQDEKLRVNNLYSDIARLTANLDAWIARDRLPLLRAQIERDQPVWFGDALQLSRSGLQHHSSELFWRELSSYRVQGGKLLLRQGDQVWASIPVTELENPVLLIALLKSFTSGRAAPSEGRA
jgi:hypothetical protein